MAKTKTAFLRRLRWSLALCLPAGEAREVAEDYAGFFDDRTREGKSETEVCAEFGSPWQVTRAILREDGRTARAWGAASAGPTISPGGCSCWWC